ncbi:hypothetical protein IFO69_11090 [Echinicola sp. CAU 1574]|uniref:Uncharacterized protein n=1 Tax=Echinicola arenosa TaxID=2774144 RepID=A0ABR9ALS2_9BACT|nr:hypothetical protein [Echinicola arenosa]MBD8489291.1 hypothetical protein [Echinicola arenosa]
MDTTQQLEEILIKHKWSLLDGETDEPVEGNFESYDISGLTFTDNFEVAIYYSKKNNVLVNKLFKPDNTLFSNLRIHSKDIISVLSLIFEWAPKLTKENFSVYVQELHKISDELIFNNNGQWVKVNINT